MIAEKKAAIAVLGAGAWGSALAILLARNGHEVYLWGRNRAALELMQQNRLNEHYLPGITLPTRLNIEPDLARALQSCRDILIVVPSRAFNTVLQQIKPHLTSQHTLAWGTKGLDPNTGGWLHETVAQQIDPNIHTALIAGPSFALEVAQGLPTALTVASHNEPHLWHWLELLNAETFRAYASSDVIGVALGGIVKNVLAIAAGICDGKALGSNARSALLTRGLHEMMMLGEALGAKSKTLMGLSGIGDIMLTCCDDQSRNRRFGLAIGRGLQPEAAQKAVGKAVEGFDNAELLLKLGAKQYIELPITAAVVDVLEGKLSTEQALHRLLERSPCYES